MGWAVQMVMGGGQMLLGAKQKQIADSNAKRALGMRKAYKTPAEVYKILQASEYAAQNGFDPTTLSYLNNQTDRAFSSAINSAEFLDANPNDLSSLFDMKLQSTQKVAAQNGVLMMDNFNQYLGSMKKVASSKDAEWMDWENKYKDKQQQAAVAKLEGTQQISEGLNTVVSGISQLGMSDLYTEKEGKRFDEKYGMGSSEKQYAKEHNLSFDAYHKKLENTMGKLDKSNFNTV